MLFHSCRQVELPRREYHDLLAPGCALSANNKVNRLFHNAMYPREVALTPKWSLREHVIAAGLFHDFALVHNVTEAENLTFLV